MSNAGRPPKYACAEDMETVIDAYFKSCEGKPLTNEDGEILTDKRGNPYLVDAHPPTVTGLALALGFNSRQSLLNYQARGKFKDIIMRAKSRCEEYAERRLYDRDGVNGAKFSLINNFKGWSDKSADESDAESLAKLDALIRGIDNAAKQ